MNEADPLRVLCPTCLAHAGRRCKRPAENRGHGPFFHEARKRASWRLGYGRVDEPPEDGGTLDRYGLDLATVEAHEAAQPEPETEPWRDPVSPDAEALAAMAADAPDDDPPEPDPTEREEYEPWDDEERIAATAPDPPPAKETISYTDERGPRIVACPTCRAPVGAPCRRPSEHRPSFGGTATHATRIRLASGISIDGLRCADCGAADGPGSFVAPVSDDAEARALGIVGRDICGACAEKYRAKVKPAQGRRRG